jgi:GTP-binding protein Era
MAAEIIREKLFERLHQEVPYAIAVEIEKWEEGQNGGQTVIHAAIYVGRSSHKAMVIGKSGAGIKEIGTLARKDIQTLIEGRAHLELWVKVREDWMEDANFLQDLGLGAEAVR